MRRQLKKQPRWISKDLALAIHERLLAEHGGALGIRDEGLLDAALASPRNHFAYEKADVFHLAAAYAFAIVRNHPFADGNKRVALTVAGLFLELNGFRLEASEEDAASGLRALASRGIDEAAFSHFLRATSSKVRAAPTRIATKKKGVGRRKK